VKVAVTGATGTIGQAVVRALAERGDEVTVLTRNPDRARGRFEGLEAVAWAHPETDPCPAQALAGRDGVIHLLGESVAQRWTPRARQAIRDSRVLGTRNLCAGLQTADPRPRVLVSQSATGYYGPRGAERVDESAPPARDDFLADLAVAWEAEAAAAERLGLRVVLTRTGMVLSPRGGAVEKLLPPFRLGLGGPVAGGTQYVPWVHLDDVVGALVFCLDTPDARGPVNVTAPEAVTNRELSRTLGRVLRRPALLPVPSAALRLLYGDMASIVTTGARVVSARLLALGYSFQRPDLEAALRATIAAR
jgi:uncharacterized protein (TIGR01777 family)